MTYINVYFDGVLKCGAYIQNAMVSVHKDYTMRQITKSIKEAGYTMFKLDGMRKLVKLG